MVSQLSAAPLSKDIIISLKGTLGVKKKILHSV